MLRIKIRKRRQRIWEKKIDRLQEDDDDGSQFEEDEDSLDLEDDEDDPYLEEDRDYPQSDEDVYNAERCRKIWRVYEAYWW